MKKIILLSLFLVACDVTTQSTESTKPLESQLPTEIIEPEVSNEAEKEHSLPFGALVFKDYRDDCWHQLELHKEGLVSAVTHPSITCIESYSEQDISPNQDVSLLHALSKGVLEDGQEALEIESYTCYFIHLLSGLVSPGYTDSMCSGEWSDSNHWVVSEDERYTIPELF